jgi:hypothetical protein
MSSATPPEKELVVAVAQPVIAATVPPAVVAIAAPGQVVIPLPPGNSPTGLGVAAAAPPLRVVQINVEENPALQAHHNLVGLYVEAIRFPDLGITVTHLRTPQDLDLLLAPTGHHRREIVLSPDLPPLDRRIRQLMYICDLPTNQPSQAHFNLAGFPPRIQSMNPSSLWNALVRPGFFVVTLAVPQRDDFQSESGGFTAYALQQRLQETEHIPGRKIAFTEHSVVPSQDRAQRQAGGAFDFGGFTLGKPFRGVFRQGPSGRR